MRRGAWVWGITYGVALLWSAIAPHDRFTWWLEVFPALGAALALAFTRRRHPLTPLLYGLLLLHCIVLMVGGHYTYANVPLFEWIKPVFGFERNHYDRLGHLMQGFVPAILAREILLRNRVIPRGGWLWLYVISVCLAFSALYELLEWQVAFWTGQAAEAFLGTQGDPWDTQSDMACALIGAVTALTLLGRLHDRQLRTCQ